MSLDNFDYKDELNNYSEKAFFGTNLLSAEFASLENEHFYKFIEILQGQNVNSFSEINYIAIIQEFGVQIFPVVFEYAQANKVDESQLKSIQEKTGIFIRSIYFNTISNNDIDCTLLKELGYCLRGLLNAFKQVYLIEVIDAQEDFISETFKQEKILQEKHDEVLLSLNNTIQELDKETLSRKESETKNNANKFSELKQALENHNFIETDSDFDLIMSDLILIQFRQIIWKSELILLSLLFHHLSNHLQKDKSFIVTHYFYKDGKPITSRAFGNSNYNLLTKYIKEKKQKSSEMELLESILSDIKFI